MAEVCRTRLADFSESTSRLVLAATMAATTHEGSLSRERGGGGAVMSEAVAVVLLLHSGIDDDRFGPL